MTRRIHKSLIFEATRACNHACLHCYQPETSSDGRTERLLNTMQTIDMLAAVIEDAGVSMISISGGEPLLRPDLFDIIDFLHGRRVAVNLITNGSLLDKATVSRLVPDRISVFEIPLLGGRAATHNLLSGVPGAFDRATTAIAQLKAAGQTVVTAFVATRLNLSEVEKTIGLAVALGADAMMFNRFNPGGHGFANINRLQASPGELGRALEVADRLSREYQFPISCSIPLPPCVIDTSAYTALSFGYCALGTADAYYTIDPRGNLRPCNHSPTILGNLTDQRFWQLVDSEKTSRYLATLPDICTSCQHVDQCKGCCRAAAESCFGSAGVPEPFIRGYGETTGTRLACE